MRAKLIYNTIWLIIFIIIFVVICVFSLFIGSDNVFSKKNIIEIFKDKGSAEYSILFEIRLVRILLGIAVGGALSLAGVILQGLFRNSLVEPYTLGISGGAALGVCVSIVLKLEYVFDVFSFYIFGFIGAILVIIFLYFLSIKRGIFKIEEVLLNGVMISFISSSLIMFIMVIADIGDLHGIIFWILGSLEETNWLLVKLAIFVSVGSLIISYFFSKDLNALSLGEEEALHLGINVEKTKKLLFILVSLLISCSVSSAGIIGFVGLVVPHFLRIILSNDYRILLVSSFLVGSSFLVLSDTLARTIISPLELPVGVITGILGGSVFIYVLRKKEIVFRKK